MAKSNARGIIFGSALKKQAGARGMLQRPSAEDSGHYMLSGEPIRPQKEIEIVRQVPEEKNQGKTVSRRPTYRRSTQFRRADFQFLFKKSSYTSAHFSRQPKLSPASILVIVRV